MAASSAREGETTGYEPFEPPMDASRSRSDFINSTKIHPLSLECEGSQPVARGAKAGRGGHGSLQCERERDNVTSPE